MAEEKKEVKKEAKVRSEGKKQKAKNKVPSKVWKYYESGKRKNKFCPKCGSGYFMAIHKNRESCGNCGYTEFTKK